MRNNNEGITFNHMAEDDTSNSSTMNKIQGSAMLLYIAEALLVITLACTMLILS